MARVFINLILLMAAMSLHSKAAHLADCLGVPKITPGQIVRVSGRSIKDVLRLVKDQGKYLGSYTTGKFEPQPNAFYLAVDEAIIGAQFNRLQANEEGTPLKKPDVYKDSDSRSWDSVYNV